jgi:site-specific recombinase XerD
MASTRRKPGQLGSQVEGYRAWLAHRGYTPQTVRNMLADLGQVGRWMSREGLVAAQLDEDAMAAFLTARQAAGRRRDLGPRAMMPLLSYLREAGVAPAAKPPQTPLGVLLGEYRIWLARERGLAAATVLRYENTARRFLQQQEAMAGGVLKPAGLTGADVNAFLLRECGRISAGSAKGRVAELRAILRFLYLQGLTPLRLGTAVPPVGGWRLATLPPTMTAADVQLLLDKCDRSSDVGVRAFAIMTLVARLGLRSIEVARLELQDVDWRAGELVVRGKARRQDRLPLPADVGEALAGTWPGTGRLQVPGGCSLPAGLRAGRSARTWSVTSSNGRAGGRASRGWGRTGCGMPWLLSCFAGAPGWPRSVRCFAIRIWPPPPCMPRSTWPRCVGSLSPGQGQPGERPGAGPVRLPAAKAFARARTG